MIAAPCRASRPRDALPAALPTALVGMLPSVVMAGLDPAISASTLPLWMAGTTASRDEEGTTPAIPAPRGTGR
jgi:hypothetical protein